MKIVHCFYSLTVGGAEILAIDLLNQMCMQHKVALVVVNDRWSQLLINQLNPKVEVHFINRKEGSRNPLPLIKLNRLLYSMRPDIVHCHEPKMGKIVRLGGAKRIYTIHDTGIPTINYQYYEALVAISDAVNRDVAGRYGRSLFTVYNGINASLFRKRDQYPQDGTIRLVQVSRMVHEKKGQDLLLQALALLRDQYQFVDFTLDLVGIGPSMDHLKQLCSSLSLNDKVSFMGERDRKWMYHSLQKYHILVQPSRFEGFGLTILEGFAAGLPIVASNIEGPAEIISQTPRGKLFAYNDVADCARVLWQMIRSYREGSMARMMQDTSSVTDEKYSIQSCAQGYLDVYRKTIEK